MTSRRRFTAEFKAKVALEALRGDQTIQEIAGPHKVHPNQVSTWKRQALGGLGAVFSNGADHARRDNESEVHDQATEYTLNEPPTCPTMWDHLRIQRLSVMMCV
jgi:transposase